MTDARTKPAEWDEGTSQHFIDYGAYFVPERETQIATVCDVIPDPEGPAHIVEICCGEGLLAEALAKRFPGATIHALDGSDTMLASTAAKLKAAGATHVTAKMEIAGTAWRRFDVPVHAFVSSLAVHHLDGPGKAQLFRDLAGQLVPGGTIVICDLAEAQTPEGLKLWENHWDAGVRERALELDGNERMLDFFREDGWNYYSAPDADPVDMPSSLFDQLTWLAEAGLERVDVHWLRAGHAIFSARKPKA